MALQFAVRSTVGKARHGLLCFPQKGVEIATPALLLYTRRGLPVHVTADLLKTLGSDAALMQLNPLHFLENPSPGIVQLCGSAHEFLSLQDNVVFAFARDPLEFQAGGPATLTTASFETPSGRRSVSAAQYMEILNSLKPDLAGSLPDEVPATSSRKRISAAVDRTLRWLDTCLGLRNNPSSPIFGAVQGGAIEAERQRSALETAKRGVEGFHLGGFGLGESPEDRSSLLKAVIDELPAEKPRHISGLGMPEEVLQGIAAGIDLFDSTYPHNLTIGGYAMIFPVDAEDTPDVVNGAPPTLKASRAVGGKNGRTTVPRAAAKMVRDSPPGAEQGDHHILMELNSGLKRAKSLEGENDSVSGGDWSKINLRSMSYRLDSRPILEGCKCFSCQNHSRAYLHHLLNTHEMLAQVLLDIHNIHHYLSFFRTIRTAISEKRFSEYCSWFLHRRMDCDGPERIDCSMEKDELFIAVSH